jgi:2-desacetyl-2-hydroxyethyl bacteriochlorophyllide A dehydrogenase
MYGVLFTGDRKLELSEFADPEPGRGEVVLQMRASGMCGSDLHVYRSTNRPEYPGVGMIQGHEPCGDIVAVGSGVPPHVAAVGDRVMVHHYWGCGTCEDCRSGWPQLCTTIAPRIPTRNEHGAHAQYMKLPAIQTMPLPEELSYRAGAAIGCGTGTAWGALNRLGNVGGKDLVILGQGPVGASATLFASALGANVIAIDISSNRLVQASRFGAQSVLNAGDVDIVEAVRQLTHGRGPELVIETSGVSSAAQHAIDMVGVWGKICYVGLGADVRFNTSERFEKQMTLMTSWTLSTVDQMRCAAFVVERALPVDSLFTHTWALDQASEAYQWFDRQAEGKGVFEF